MSPRIRAFGAALVCVATFLLGIASVAALTAQSEVGLYEDRVFARTGGVVGPVARDLSQLPSDDSVRLAWDRFVAARGGDWNVQVDARSGLPAIAAGRGIAWFAGAGNDLTAGTAPDIDRLAARAEAFLLDHPDILGAWNGQIVLDREASGPRGPNVWHVRFAQVIDGVPVEQARYEFHVSHGNLVAFGADRWAPVAIDASPRLTAPEARAKLDAYVRPQPSDGIVDLADPELTLIALDPAADSGEAWNGVRGEGYAHRLIWRFRFTDFAEIATWTGEVDAHTGDIVAFYDDTRHDTILGHVNPISDDGDCPTGGCPEPAYPMPFVDYSVDGGAVQYTGQFGLYECASLGSTVETTLDGQYFWINDQCGAISESTTCDESLDLGLADGINCGVSAGSSAGNTDAARSAYYSLNTVNRKARFWITGNSWLDGQVECRTNVNSTCNASWGGRINMYRAGNGCGNTSQIQGVVVHEWGHGFDQNDGGGYDSSSEAYADVVAIFESRTSCIGRGFYNDGRTCGGYGDSCLTCTGIRDHDWDAREDHTPATPAGFYAGNCGSGSGPCGKAVHCEAYVPGETMFDLATRDLPAAGLDPDSAWQLAERLWYQSRPGSGGNIHNCSLPNSDSCGTGSWYHQLRVQDDDDGNLANGTPHAAAIFAAFDRHGIACGSAGDAENQSTSSCPTLAAPVFTARALTNAVELTWDPVADASSYRVYRNENGCDRSQFPVAEVDASTTSYTDEGLANDFPVFYRLQAIGSNAACESAVSTCLETAAQPLAGRIKFNQATYGCGNEIVLKVTDANHSSSSITVTIWSDAEPTPESVVLAETAVGSGKFVGSIFTTPDPAAADGMLSTADGGSITAEYVDEDDGAGGINVAQQSSALSDCVFPVITNVGVDAVTGTAATVAWTTNEISDTTVRWGGVTPPANEASGAARVLDHDVRLTGLAECTVYYYAVESTDPAGNVAVDDNGGQYYRFETLGDFGSGLQACHAGQVSSAVPTYSCNDAATFEVVDIDLNQDPLTAEATTVIVTSTTETAGEVIVLTETGANTSIFRGTIATASGNPTADGVLQTADGDAITATYFDEDDGAGYPATSFDIASADCAGASITGLTVDGLTDARATFRWTTDEAADSVVEWGFTPALGQTASRTSNVTNHAVALTSFDMCGEVHFRVRSTDLYGNVSILDNGGQPFTFRTWDIPGLYVLEDFESGAAGWSLDGEWEVGPPLGLGGSTGLADPAVAYNNDGVLGHDLSGQGPFPGDYEPNTVERAQSPDYDGSGWSNTKLIVHRRLNVASDDQVLLYLQTGPSGIPIYRNDGDSVSSSSFSTQTYDVAARADGANPVWLRFDTTANGSGNASGWNVDHVIFKDGSLPDYGPCGTCDTAPAFAGATSAIDNDACGAAGVTVSWQAAAAWGTGGSGTYSVYRDTAPGFVPGAGNRIATGVATLSYQDAGAPAGQALYYLVRAENDEACGTGPANGGVTDANEAYVAVSPTTSQPTPAVVDTVAVELVAATHVRLTWDAVGAATSYRIYRSTSPTPDQFGFLAEVDGTVFEDLGEGANANSYYYLVRAVNACDVEGP